MADFSSKPKELSAAVEAIRRGEFSEADAERLFDSGRDAVTFVLLALAASGCSAHAPSSATPLYEKPSPKPKPKRHKPRGGRAGH